MYDMIWSKTKCQSSWSNWRYCYPL